LPAPSVDDLGAELFSAPPVSVFVLAGALESPDPVEPVELEPAPSFDAAERESVL
jgi:hypothetical protein